MKKIPLTKARENQKLKIIEIIGSTGLRNRMMSMGIYSGREIIKLSQFALKGPVTIKTGRSTVALGFGMANKIIVEIE